MHIDWKEVAAFLLTAWIFIRRWIDAIDKIVKPLCVEAEALAKDGLIDKDDRKTIVMKAVWLLEQQKTIKLNFISRFIVSKVADSVASKLPNITVSAKAEALLTQARQ
jgi:hypothetical protein